MSTPEICKKCLSSQNEIEDLFADFKNFYDHFLGCLEKLIWENYKDLKKRFMVDIYGT